jgi:hypothetical protein
MTARVARKTVEGSAEWAADNLEYTRSLLRVIRGDAQTITQHMGSWRRVAERHGADFEAFVRDELGATVEQLEHIEALAKLASRKAIG